MRWFEKFKLYFKSESDGLQDGLEFRRSQDKSLIEMKRRQAARKVLYAPNRSKKAKTARGSALSARN